MNPHRQAVRIVSLAVALVALYSAIVSVIPWHAELAESNFQANLIRLETFLFGSPPHTVLCGSSLSGRLVPSYFRGTSLAPVANLGLDGAGPLYATDIVLQRESSTSVIILEENLLLRTNRDNELLLEQAVQNPSFKLARYIPALQAQSRPSSMLYTLLKSHRSGGAIEVPVAMPGTAVTASLNDRSSEYHKFKQVWTDRIRELRARASQIVLIRLPTGTHPAPEDSFQLGGELARELNIPEIDMRTDLARRGQAVLFSDGLHLAPASAREVSHLIASRIDQAKSSN
jgi:hypothetical protein